MVQTHGLKENTGLWFLEKVRENNSVPGCPNAILLVIMDPIDKGDENDRLTIVSFYY